MPSIVNYLTSVQIILVEFGKYFSLLLLSVLAFRIWRSSLKMPAASRLKSMCLAGFISFLAIATGYFSIRNSMGILYFYYGEQAFNSGRLEQAYGLFDSSAKFWDGGDVTGRKGVCLLLLGNPDQGEALLEKARNLRQGGNASFEQYHAGLYYLIRDQKQKAIPLLAAAAADPVYHWTVLKYFAAMELDAGYPQDAAERMKPYLEAEVTEGDQAYIVAALKLAAGKPDEARALLDKFSSSDLPPYWKSRFEKLQTQIKNH